MQATEVPTVPETGQFTVAMSARAATVTVCAVLPVTGGVEVSDTESDTVKVPLDAYVWLEGLPDPVALASPKFHE